MKVLLLIPAFNEAPTIARLIRGGKQYIKDVLVVDDGSLDDTSLKARSEGAIVERFEKNMGKGQALKAGFTYALANGYESVVTMDGDGQHDPRDIENFLLVLERYDLVLGNRMEERATIPKLRLLANTVSSLMVSALAGSRIYDSQTGFRSYSVALLKQLQLNCSGYDLETEVIIKTAWLGFRIGHCRIQTIYAGEVSRFKNVRDSLRFLKVIGKSLVRI